MNEKILIISHGHPRFNKGGGEIAAYNLFKQLLAEGKDAYFLAACYSPLGRHGGTPFAALNEREILFYSTMTDFFWMYPGDRQVIWSEFDEFLRTIKPTIVHFHHYLHVGIEMLRQVRNYEKTLGSKVKLVCTLHEFVAICPNQGQMINRNNYKLCYESAPISCVECLPQYTEEQMFMRKLFIKSFFELVDHFISPSHFLKQRYVEWGLDAEKITVLENGQEEAAKLGPKNRQTNRGTVTFAYFGQINPYKGLDVLLSALDHLTPAQRKKIRLHIHGSGLENQPSEFVEKVEKLLADYEELIDFQGPYESEELGSLMAETDWVVMPSIWWENSPLVIQEAFKFGRPVICSNIGGMAEKVRDGVDGFHFNVGKSASLAAVMIRVTEEKGIWDAVYKRLPMPLTIEASCVEHIQLYDSISKV